MTTEINHLIEQLTGEIAVRQDALTALHRLRGVQPAPKPTPGPSREGNKTTKRKYAKRAGMQPLKVGKGNRLVTSAATSAPTGGATDVVDKLDKPDSIGGAMKFIIRQNPTGIFNTDSLLAAMEADADFAELLKEHADKAPSQHPITGNLNYWCKTEKIRESGSGFVVNREHRAFFGIED